MFKKSYFICCIISNVITSYKEGAEDDTISEYYSMVRIVICRKLKKSIMILLNIYLTYLSSFLNRELNLLPSTTYWLRPDKDSLFSK